MQQCEAAHNTNPVYAKEFIRRQKSSSMQQYEALQNTLMTSDQVSAGGRKNSLMQQYASRRPENHVTQ